MSVNNVNGLQVLNNVCECLQSGKLITPEHVAQWLNIKTTKKTYHNPSIHAAELIPLLCSVASLVSRLQRIPPVSHTVPSTLRPKTGRRAEQQLQLPEGVNLQSPRTRAHLRTRPHGNIQDTSAAVASHKAPWEKNLGSTLSHYSPRRNNSTPSTLQFAGSHHSPAPPAPTSHHPARTSIAKVTTSTTTHTQQAVLAPNPQPTTSHIPLPPPIAIQPTQSSYRPAATTTGAGATNTLNLTQKKSVPTTTTAAVTTGAGQRSNSSSKHSTTVAAGGGGHQRTTTSRSPPSRPRLKVTRISRPPSHPTTTTLTSTVTGVPRKVHQQKTHRSFSSHRAVRYATPNNYKVDNLALREFVGIPLSGTLGQQLLEATNELLATAVVGHSPPTNTTGTTATDQAANGSIGALLHQDDVAEIKRYGGEHGEQKWREDRKYLFELVKQGERLLSTREKEFVDYQNKLMAAARERDEKSQHPAWDRRGGLLLPDKPEWIDRMQNIKGQQDPNWRWGRSAAISPTTSPSFSHHQHSYTYTDSASSYPQLDTVPPTPSGVVVDPRTLHLDDGPIPLPLPTATATIVDTSTELENTPPQRQQHQQQQQQQQQPQHQHQRDSRIGSLSSTDSGSSSTTTPPTTSTKSEESSTSTTDSSTTASGSAQHTNHSHPHGDQVGSNPLDDNTDKSSNKPLNYYQLIANHVHRAAVINERDNVIHTEMDNEWEQKLSELQREWDQQGFDKWVTAKREQEEGSEDGFDRTVVLEAIHQMIQNDATERAVRNTNKERQLSDTHTTKDEELLVNEIGQAIYYNRTEPKTPKPPKMPHLKKQGSTKRIGGNRSVGVVGGSPAASVVRSSSNQNVKRIKVNEELHMAHQVLLKAQAAKKKEAEKQQRQQQELELLGKFDLLPNTVSIPQPPPKATTTTQHDLSRRSTKDYSAATSPTIITQQPTTWRQRTSLTQQVRNNNSCSSSTGTTTPVTQDTNKRVHRIGSPISKQSGTSFSTRQSSSNLKRNEASNSSLRLSQLLYHHFEREREEAEAASNEAAHVIQRRWKAWVSNDEHTQQEWKKRKEEFQRWAQSEINAL